MESLKRLAAAVLLAVAGASTASDFPARSIRLITTNAAGGATDILARVLAEPLSRAFGQPVFTDNRPGANGMIAADAVARSLADGHTLLVAADSLFVINPHLYRDAWPELVSQLVPVSPLAENTLLLLVDPRLPVRSVPELVAYARRATKPLAYSSSAVGSQHHLLMERFRVRAGIELLHVPYKGGAAAANAVSTGEVAFAFGSTGAGPLVRSGRLRALAVTGARRLAQYPDVPALAEYYPGLHERVWFGLFAPAGTPEPVLERVRSEVQAALEETDSLARLLEASSMRPLKLGSAEFAAMIQQDRARYGEIIQRIGLAPR